MAMFDFAKIDISAIKKAIAILNIEQFDEASVAIIYEGILAQDLPNKIKSGSTINLNGRSQFSFKDGKIWRIVDIS
jgi:hypothetical protein